MGFEQNIESGCEGAVMKHARAREREMWRGPSLLQRQEGKKMKMTWREREADVMLALKVENSMGTR
uniref:Uncharacterized protein n=1 Tax=Nelumbo nucifera TaxID=4432 RepID=A0A822XC06_NELNU|nr:TPA_asm: hypothetical protein HUJ06_020407 [Nelumbo nucifera]